MNQVHAALKLFSGSTYQSYFAIPRTHVSVILLSELHAGSIAITKTEFPT